jgi:superoxide dismutase, Cu-Zn family
MSKTHDETTATSPRPARPSWGTAAALGVVGLVSIAGLAAAAPAEARGHAGARAGHHAAAHVFQGSLRDLQPSRSDLLDGARARLVFVRHASSSTFVLVVSGVAPEGGGKTYGAHLHAGPCVAGDPAAAGPHYNQSSEDGVVPPVVSDQTEVWLDVTVGPDGGAVAVTHVPFVPTLKDRAVVLHEKATDDHGTAGARLACLPVNWS